MSTARTRRTCRIRSRALHHAAVAGAAATAFAALAVAPAFAHVSVQPSSAAQGGYSTVAFKVPNERDNASTVKVEVSFPADHPIASVSTQPVPGWKTEITRTELDTPLEVHGERIGEAVTGITWSGGRIAPGEFQQFPISLGPLPEDTDKLVFKALQTYDNDEVVRWIEEPKEGAQEPETPAPVLALTAAGEDGHDHGTPDASHGDEDPERTASEGGDDPTARALGIAGIAVGAAGVTFGVLAGRRRTGSA